MTYLIAGASGQLGQEFVRTLQQRNLPYAAPPETQFDITAPDAIAAVLAETRPDVLINCAAYTNVEQAEQTPAPAYLVNETAVGHLASACAIAGVKLVHFSTDYSFDGTKKGLYTEEDTPAPLNEYGRSKLAGEVLLASHSVDSLVLRLSWVFGHGPQNFFHKLQQWSAGRDVMNVVYDQIATPTYTADIVDWTLLALGAKLSGLYHFSNDGYASRYECARELFDQLGAGPLILPVGSDAFPSPVQRPFFSAMSSAKLQKAIHQTPPTWKDALGRYLTRAKIKE